MAIPTQSFTVTSQGGLLRELVTKCFIAPAFDPQSPVSTHPPLSEFDAIWDTGATNCVISPRVVQKCNLKPIGMANVHTANGSCVSELFLINIRLPNGVGFKNVRVTNQPLLGHPVLIGMDVISQGDFAVTNHNRSTKFSFRFPSRAHIDFVEQQKSGSISAYPKIGRNEPCPCGSGKKYKKCHGRTGH